MNDKIEIIDKTVEGAIEKGLLELGIKKDNAQIEVVTEPGSGFLGIIGSKQAKVLMSVKLTPGEYVEKTLSYILDKMGVEGIINVEQDNEDLKIDVSGKNIGVLIGRRGQNLNSLQYLINVIMHRQYENFPGRVVLDAENYRQERERSLKLLAENIAFKAEKQKQQITLEPMTPQDRRIIHITLKDKPNINTFSSGEEPFRKVVISPE